MRKLLALVALATTLAVGGDPVHAATLLFLNVPGIPGTSTFERAQNEIELLSYGLEVAASKPTKYGTVGVCAVGKTKQAFSDFCVTKRVDIASPKLFLAAAQATLFPSVTISVFGTGGDPSAPPLARYVLSNAFVSSLTASGTGADDAPVETACFRFNRAQVTTTRVSETGMSTSEVAGFDACQVSAF
jgi:type VI protein secretion system component Hcp